MEKSGVSVSEAIVFIASIRESIVVKRLRFVVSRVQKDSDRRRHITAGDQVIKDDRNAPATVDILHSLAVLKNHQGSRLVFVVLGRDIDPPIPSRAGENSGFPSFHFLDFAMWNIVSGDGIGMRFPFRFGFDDGNIGRFGVLSPEPSKRVRKVFSSVFAAMATIGHHKLVVVSCKLQGGCHILVTKRPIPMQIIQVFFAFLQIDLNRFWRLFCFANQARIRPSATDIGETTDMAKDFSELIRPLPCDRKCANTT